MHEIKQLDSIEDPDVEKQAQNDGLYRIFGEMEGKSATYMRSWLGFFVTVHHCFFVSCASVYLRSKGLKLDTWMESIKAGRCGDILVLYGLCLLTDSHCVVHLNRNCVWSSLDYVPEDHTVLLEWCEIHLCYAGNGIFVQLVPREIPVPSPVKTKITGHTNGRGIIYLINFSERELKQAQTRQKTHC